MKKTIFVLLIVFLMSIALIGCSTQADTVSYNVSQEADNFNVVRRLVVINGRTDKPFFEMVGAFSFELEDTNGNKRIICVVETGEGQYKKHSIGLPEEAFWSVEDISGANVSKYKYQVNFLPEKIVPIEFVSHD